MGVNRTPVVCSDSSRDQATEIEMRLRAVRTKRVSAGAAESNHSDVESEELFEAIQGNFRASPLNDKRHHS
jgi:hypothetical protein